MESLGLPPAFGFVVLTTVASVFLLQWLGIKVAMARKKYEVSYPKMYSGDDRFNCVQRAHQNTLEVYPTYLILQILGGLYAPKLGAVCGLIWIAGRVAYALGYYTGDPEKRKWGAFGYIGLLTLLVCAVMFGLSLLGLF
ncbi:microsomal glutathione S-transferase 3-like isoform X1 [Mizuhopecten yessoensis]|uniref:Glutathione S-transferase 3, mitochondrial n=1 Tax=Mizuhopecten yessoensis TaxID=6573 RepID=A0A210Q1W1_MIZYE|nr:microsomal glutathione S-transferase 3-like isoform X1 [Mizuhopecten yessoensis]OWF42712.1 Microsomal glutathione S-transferase 3 [Mizuhopecten yessoensis]